jgi:sporulation protein YlmC with PRC-barrel domain
MIVNAELLVGRKVHDPTGRVVGRIEDMRVDVDGTDHVVTEYHLGGGALIERIAGSISQLPILRLLPFSKPTVIHVPWHQMDLSDPSRPRVVVPRDQLAALQGR